MPEQLEDLWPDLDGVSFVTPASILKTQATALTQKTNGLLQGEVETGTIRGDISHKFLLVVPALENYRYSLLLIRHAPAALYPVYVVESPLPIGWNPGVLENEASFRDWLRLAFTSNETKRILHSLLAQARS